MNAEVGTGWQTSAKIKIHTCEETMVHYCSSVKQCGHEIFLPVFLDFEKIGDGFFVVAFTDAYLVKFCSYRMGFYQLGFLQTQSDEWVLNRLTNKPFQSVIYGFM